MSRRKKCSKVDLLNNIPEEFVKIIFRIALVLVVLNVISLSMTFMYNVDSTIALLSTGISVLISAASFVIIKKQNKKA